MLILKIVLKICYKYCFIYLIIAKITKNAIKVKIRLLDNIKLLKLLSEEINLNKINLDKLIKIQS